MAIDTRRAEFMREMTALDEEMAVLGSCLQAEWARHEARGILTPDMFAEGIHAAIFDAIMDGRGAVEIVKAMADDEAMKSLGGSSAYIARLIGTAAPRVTFGDHVSVIIDAWRRRELFDFCLRGEDMARDWSQGMDATMTELSQQIAEIRAGGMTDTIASAGQAATAAIEAMDAEAASTSSRIIKTGLHDLDRIIGGAHRSEVTIMAGRPGMGKSMLAMSIAATAAANGFASLYFSLEMPQEDLAARLLAARIAEQNANYSTMRVPYKSIIDGTANPAMRQHIERAAEWMNSLPLGIDARGGLTIENIYATAARWAARLRSEDQNPGMIFIDHIGLVAPRWRGQKEYERLTEISQNVMQMAKELKIAVVVLSQLNRAVEARQDKRPMLADLRGSGALEQDASIVLFPFRESYYLEKEAVGDDEQAQKAALRLQRVQNTLEITVAKARHGPTGTCTVFADMATGLIKSLARQEEIL